MTTLFAIVKTNCGREVRRIDANSKISDAATSEFTKQYSDFFSLCGAEERKKRRFEDTWTKANEDEVLFIENFVDGIGISDAIKDPTSVSIFDPAKDMPYLRGMFTTSEEGFEKILFQLVDYRHLIIRAKGDRWWYFRESGGRKTYIEQLSDSFCFDSKLTAVCEGRFLYFRSFKNASMLFDLSKYMKEASVETVVEFLSHNSIETPENALEFADAFNSTHKRLVSAVIGYGALDRLAPREIQVRAKKSRANVDIDISDSGKVIIPEDAVAREKVLQFLANVIVSSYLDDDSDYEAQATRRL